MPRAADVDLRVFDLSGREVGRLARGSFDAGRHELTWAGQARNSTLAAGIYFVRLRTEAGVATRLFVARH
jgi:hypothetical protein